ncbi:MAG TPA: hypothetical protein VGN52_23300 [Burkholderiales bacterium]
MPTGTHACPGCAGRFGFVPEANTEPRQPEQEEGKVAGILVVLLGMILCIVPVGQGWRAALAWGGPPARGHTGAAFEVGAWLPVSFFAFGAIALIVAGALTAISRPLQSGAAWARLSPRERGRHLLKAVDARESVLRFGWWLTLLLFGGYLLCSMPFWWTDVRLGRVEPWLPAVPAALALWVCAHLLLGRATRFAPAREPGYSLMKRRWVVHERKPWIELAVLAGVPWMIWTQFDRIRQATLKEVLELFALVMLLGFILPDVVGRLLRLFQRGRCTVILERAPGAQDVSGLVKRLPEWLFGGGGEARMTVEIRILEEGRVEPRRLGPVAVQAHAASRTGTFTLPAALLRECAEATGNNLGYRLWFSLRDAPPAHGEWLPLPPATVYAVADSVTEGR